MDTAVKPRVFEYTRPWMYAKQRDAMFCKQRYGCIEASTKAGKTVSAICWLAEQAMQGKAGRNYWWVAPIFPQAAIAFKRMCRGLPIEVYKPNNTVMTITLINGAIMSFKSGDNADSLYGEDVYAAVIDEASRVGEDAWFAVRSTLTQTQGPIRMIGNVKGRRNWFYNLCRKAEAGDPTMHYSKLIAADAVAAGVLSADEVEDARQKLPEAVFRELYLAEPSDDGGNPFGIKAIGECIAPLSNGAPRVWGVDLAKSHDWTWAIALDDDGVVCRSERWQGPWDITRQKLIGMIGQAQALIDSTGVGDPIVEELQKVCYRVEGYKFTSNSKQQLMEGLASDIHQRNVRFPDGILKMELESYEYTYTATGVRYSAPEGQHDDGVCALALAASMRRARKRSILDVLGGKK